MGKIKFFALSLMVTVAMFGCSKYDDTELKNDMNDLKSRVEKLEVLCGTINGQITSLQEIISALETKDYVTGVTPIMEGTKEIGYTITFSKSKPITIKHGNVGLTPIIGVKQDTDGKYYWTEKIGDADAVWVLNENGDKICATGNKPVLSVAEFEGRLYWQIDGKWLTNGENKVPATGDDGDAIFANGGIDNTQDNYVVFTLADGVTKITLPKKLALSISIGNPSDGNALIKISGETTLSINLPATFKESDYSAITADVVTAGDIVTKAMASDWSVRIIKPTFTNGIYNNDAEVVINPNNSMPGSFIVRITLIDSKGNEIITSRPIRFGLAVKVNVASEGGLKAAIEAMSYNPQVILSLTVDGDLNGTSDATGTDYHYIAKTLKNLEELTLTNATSIPEGAFKQFWSSPNKTLKQISAPQVTTIGKSAFAHCSALESINMPILMSIGENAFNRCVGLKKFNSTSVMTIDGSAFIECSSLESISFSKVNTIGRYTFSDCIALTNISLPEVTTIGENAFKNCNSLTTLTDEMLPKLEKINGVNTFEGCTSLAQVSLSNVTSIEAASFINCTSLKEVSLPKVDIITSNAFSGCSLLKTVNFPEATSVKEQAFVRCSALEIISLAKVKELGNYAFWDCISLKNIVLPAVEKMDSRVFSGCVSLISVELCTALGHLGLISANDYPFESVTTTNIELTLGAGEISKTTTRVGDNATWNRMMGTLYEFKKIIQK